MIPFLHPFDNRLKYPDWRQRPCTNSKSVQRSIGGPHEDDSLRSKDRLYAPNSAVYSVSSASVNARALAI